MSAPTIARLKITLDNVEPVVLRRIEAPLSIPLDRLHLAIQAAMGWTNSHLYEISVKEARWSDPGPEWGRGGPHNARKTCLGDVLDGFGTKTLRYLYDFGDDWQHTIKVERLVEPEPGVLYPRLIEAVGQCPPEDVGGPWGYAELLEAIGNPDHERHDEFREWIGGGFNPKDIDADALAEELAALAKRWSRKPAAKRKRASQDQ